MATMEIERKVDGADKRSFWTMVVLAIQNAFNDKAAQVLLIALGVQVARMAAESNSSAPLTEDALKSAGSIVAPTLSILILAPFIFFSPIAGWFSDRFSKTHILRAGALMQVAVLGLIYWSITTHQLVVAYVGFALLALQSTILSPAKKGIIKEMMGSEKLGFASGVVELTSVLAICVGQIVSGKWFDARMVTAETPWIAVHWPILLLFLCSIPAFLLSFSLKVYPSPSKRPFKLGIIWEHIGQMKDLLGNQRIKLSAIAIGFFWFVGGFINITAFQVGNDLSAGSGGTFGTQLAILLAYASGGMILGGAIASLSSRRSIELGLVPMGGIIMVVASLAVAVVGIESAWFKVWLGLTGLGAAMFLVPLNAHLQDKCSEKKRGKVIAGSNLLDCLAGALAVGFQFGMSALGVGYSMQFLIVAVLCLIVTIYTLKILPQHFVRFTILTVVRVFYRQKMLHSERLPSTGGVLIVPNHISYIDAFILTASSTRPIRFLMYDSYFKKAGLVKWFIQFFDTVPISANRAKEAIQLAADAVEEGGVVCIFPEGQLSRTGCMNEMKRGFEMIARKANCPVVPVYIDGLWGSIFSFEREKFIWKRPYRLQYGVTVAWGEAMPGKDATANVVRQELWKLGSEAFTHRDQLRDPEKTVSKGKVKILAGDSGLLDKLEVELSEMSVDEQYSRVHNALQVGELHAICRGDVVAMRVDEMGQVAGTLGVLLPKLNRLGVVCISADTTEQEMRKWHDEFQIKTYIGGSGLASLVKQAGLKGANIYDVSATEVAEGHFPIATVADRVIAMSMPHPAAVTATNQFQAGWKESSLGRMLPGYYIHSDAESSESKVVQAKPTSALLCRVEVDKEGFLMRIVDEV